MTNDEPKDKPVTTQPGLKQCRANNLDEAPPGDSMPNYPSPNPQYAYNYETPTHKILILAADGHHGPDRWDLTADDSGTTEAPQHEHDDWKRNPPTILQDADPRDSRIGQLALARVPDASYALSDKATYDPVPSPLFKRKKPKD